MTQRLNSLTPLGVSIGLILLSTSLGIAQEATENATATTPEVPAIVSKYSAAAVEKWEADVVKLEAQNKAEQHPDDAILFIGSSSIRRWKTIVEDMAPYHPINRGYGGARYSDLASYAKRLIEPHHFRAVVIFVANDISSDKNQPDTPLEDAKLLVQHIIDVAVEHAPTAPVFIIEVTPTMSRWKLWAKTRGLNATLREICLTHPQVFFIETAESYLGPDNKPIERFFVKDRLHLNEDGYDVWAGLIKSKLDTHLKSNATAQQ